MIKQKIMHVLSQLTSIVHINTKSNTFLCTRLKPQESLPKGNPLHQQGLFPQQSYFPSQGKISQHTAIKTPRIAQLSISSPN